MANFTCPPTAPTPTDRFIEGLLDNLDHATLQFLCENQSFSPYVVTMWRAGAILVILYIGFTFLFGGSATFKDLMAQLAKIVFVLAVVSFASTYNTIFYTLSNILPNEIAGQLVANGASADAANAASTGGVNRSLNNYMDDGFALSSQIEKDAGFIKGITVRLFQGITIIVTVLFAVAALLLLTLSKLASGVLLTVGPFFIIGLMFEKTKGYFEAWFKALMSFSLIPVILYALLAIILAIVKNYSDAAAAEDLARNGAFASFIAPVIVISLIGVALITQVQSIAAQLAGGIALSTQAGLAWAGRQIQDSAGKAARQAASKGGQKARAGAGAIARSPFNYARGIRDAAPSKPSGGEGGKPSALSRFAAKGRQIGSDFASGFNRIRRDGASYTAGRATTRTIEAVNRRRIAKQTRD